ncbi:phage head spike fiber domain-containing protein [Rahnella aceris]|uniref:phage head spike fiber domain-containing protein n=1 Tax=Rahnella sp. (strain Y9602) TaxID=2703885 RepID=UPI003663019B
MALELKSNSEYKGDPSQLPGANAPMPDNASLYLDFKNGLYLARNITTGKLFRSTLLSGIINFARASQKSVVGPYGILQNVANNEAAFIYDPVTRKRLGVTLHNSTSNKVIYSEDFTQSTWAKTGVGVAAAAAISPDGNTSATLVTEGTDNTVHTLEEVNATATAVNSYHTYSIYVKKGTARFVQLYALPASSGNTFANFDLEKGIVARASPSVQQAGIEPGPNGYWRISITIRIYAAYTAGGAGMAFINDGVNAGLMPAYAGTGKAVYVWGAQLEVREAATSYVSTSGASGTRAADTLNANNSVTGFMSADAGTVYVEAVMPGVNQSPLGALELGNGFFGVESTDTSANYIAFYQKNLASQNGVISASSYNAGANTSLDTKKGTAGAGRSYRGFLSYDAMTLLTYDEYGLTQVSTSVASALFGRICVGRGRSTDKNPDALWFNGTIQKIVYYPSRLTEEQMADIYDAGV